MFLFPQFVPLVVELFPLGERDLALDPAFLEIEFGGDEREPLLPHLPQQPLDLVVMEQELTGAKRRVIELTGRGIQRDVAVDQSQLAVVVDDIGVPEIDLPIAQRLDLAPHQRHSRLVLFQKEIPERRLLVRGDQLFA